MAPWDNGILRPSEELREALMGRVAWADVPDAIKSRASLEFYRAAVEILAEKDNATKRKKLNRVPASVRPHVEKEIKRLLALRKSEGSLL